MKKTIIIFGPQGSGKGTQAKKLADEFGFVHISTGMIFREAQKSGGEIGKELSSYIIRGKLVPEEIVNEIVKKRLEIEDVEERSYILDGYPRTLEQAEFLNSISKVSDAVLIDISDEEAVRRISGRVVSKKTGINYHLIFDPPPKGEETFVRKDDRDDVVRERLRIYHDRTKPILEIYSRAGILKKIDGEQKINKVYEDIKKALKI